MISFCSSMECQAASTGLQTTEGVSLMNTVGRFEKRMLPLRILVPINAGESSLWGIHYAVRRKLEGYAVEVVLLNVGEKIEQWQVLRFRTQEEISAFQTQRAEAFFQDACRALALRDIPCNAVFRQGDVVLSILDVAEDLQCDEIVFPQPKRRAKSLFSPGIAAQVRKQQSTIPVVAVDRRGVPT